MMQKSDSKPTRKVRSVAMLPAIFLAVCAVYHPAVASRLDAMSSSMALTSATPGKVTTKPAKKQVAAQPEDDTTVMVNYEQQPLFPGGAEGLFKYLTSNMRYPQDALKAGKEGRVLVSFKIDIDGSIKDAKVERGVDPALDAEALRLVNGMPAWTPGYFNGKPVKVTYNLPVTFKL